jgi:hypothetical protein
MASNRGSPAVNSYIHLPLADQAGVNSLPPLWQVSASATTGQCGYRKAAKSCVCTHTSALLPEQFPRCDSTYSDLRPHRCNQLEIVKGGSRFRTPEPRKSTTG